MVLVGEAGNITELEKALQVLKSVAVHVDVFFTVATHFFVINGEIDELIRLWFANPWKN